MSQQVTLHGETHTIPSAGERGWAAAVSLFLAKVAQHAVTSVTTLAAELYLGGGFGIRAPWFRSATATPAEAGVVRLARADLVKWRNQADSADVALGVDSSNNLEWAGVDVALASTAAPAVVTLGFLSSLNDTTIRFACPGGPAAAAGTTELQIPAPYAGVVRNLYVKCASAPTGTCTFTPRKNGVDQISLATGVTSGNTTGSNLSGSISVAAGDLISVKFVMTSGNAPGATTVSFQLTKA